MNRRGFVAALAAGAGLGALAKVLPKPTLDLSGKLTPVLDTQYRMVSGINVLDFRGEPMPLNIHRLMRSDLEAHNQMMDQMLTELSWGTG